LSLLDQNELYQVSRPPEGWFANENTLTV